MKNVAIKLSLLSLLSLTKGLLSQGRSGDAAPTTHRVKRSSRRYGAVSFVLMWHILSLLTSDGIGEGANPPMQRLLQPSLVPFKLCLLIPFYFTVTKHVLNEWGLAVMFRYFPPIFTERLASLSVKLPAVMMYLPPLSLNTTTGVLL